MLTFGALLVSGTLLLVFNESQTPGFCPSYPVLGVPACYVVLVYFTIITTTLFLDDGAIVRILFYGTCALAIITGSYFSTLELITPGTQCPQLFGIPLPLCFTVAPTIILVLVLGWVGRPKASDSPG